MGKQQLSGEEFNKFFQDIVNAGLKGKEEKGEAKSILEIMDKYDLEPPSLPSPLNEKVMSLLSSKTKSTEKILHDCTVCEYCRVCNICLAYNAAAGGAYSAVTLHAID